MSMSRVSILVPSLLALSAVGFAADAPAPAVTPAPATSGEKVTIASDQEHGPDFKADTVHATKLDLSLQETPQSITVIPRALMQSQGTFSLRDAVRNAPGLTIASGEGGTTGDAFNIRGFAARGDIYLDGIKDDGLYFRDTFNLEQVEVLKGSSALLFGRGSVGGAINQVTRKPTDKLQANAAVTVGTDNLMRGSVGAGGPLVEHLLGGRVDAYVHDADSFRDNIHVHRVGVAPTLVVELDPHSDLVLQSFHQREKSDMDYGLARWKGRPADVDASTFYGFKDDDFQTYDVDQYTIAINHQVNDHVSVRNATRLSIYDREYRTNIPSGTGTYFTDSSLDTTTISQALRSNTQRNVFNQTDLTVNGALGKHAASLVSGIEVGTQAYDFKGRNSVGTRTVSILNPTPADSWGAGRAEDLSLYGTHNENHATSLSLYTMGTIELVTHLKAVLGLRWDQVESMTTTNRGATLGANGLPSATPLVMSTFDREDYHLSPRAGLIYTPDDNVSVYASYSTSFSPSTESLSTSLTVTTAEVSPELGRTFEIGSKADLIDETLQLSGAIFRTEKYNARTADGSGGFSLDGDQRTDGIEAGAAGTITKQWRVFVGGALLDARFIKSNDTTTYTDYDTVTAISPGGQITYASVANVPVQNNHVTGVPTTSGTLWTTYEIIPGLTIGGGAIAMGSRYVNTANTETLPGYMRFDATIGYAFRAADAAWNAQINAFNLLDTKYYEASNGSFATVGATRSGQLTLSTEF